MSAIDLAGLVTAAQSEVVRQMQVCNACRYCEGLCAVFPAMELRRDFSGGDVDYLANLCHSCGACHYDCQYAPPHDFAINVPAAMSDLREESYARYAWPAFASGFFEKNGMWVTMLSALAVAGFIAGFVAWSDPDLLFAAGDEPGAFYRIMPHTWMAGLFGAVFLFAIGAMIAGLVRFWRASGKTGDLSAASLWQALWDAGRLTHLDGGGMGCMNESERPSDRRRLYHHFTFYGFLLCLASTASGTLLHYGFDWQAPYPFWSPTVLLGTLGGLGLVVGPLGLMVEKRRRDPALRGDAELSGMGTAFLWMLILVSITGLALLALRATSAMGLLLALHLGFVFALFLSMPYGKFVHGLYRFAALVRHAHEQRRS